MSTQTLPEDFVAEVRSTLSGELRLDEITRILYSTDASLYQIEPIGVFFPRDADELAGVVELAARYKVPILPRGSGSSLAGQAIGPALILDLTHHVNHILAIHPEERTAIVEPGVVLQRLNRTATRYGLQLGPDPASADRATLGGMIGNNATGAHSIVYGMMADHLLATDVVLADGSLATFNALPVAQARRKAQSAAGIEAELYRQALIIRQQHAESIRQGWPRTWRRASGYNLNYLLPWSPNRPPQWNQGNRPYPPLKTDKINLAALLAGSEGTLGVIRRATVRLVPITQHTVLAVLAFDEIPAACDAVPKLLDTGPSVIELLPRELIQLARSVPAYARQLTFVQGDPAALLVVEFSGDDPNQLMKRAGALGKQALIIPSAESQRQVWEVRKAGLGLLLSRPGDIKPITFIEDIAVPVEHLGKFVRGMQAIFAEHHTQGDFYAHASAGCLHVRPLVNLKTLSGVQTMRSIAQTAAELCCSLGGAISGEHGDGIARSEWLELEFGSAIVSLFRDLKRVADPNGILNPGKIPATSSLEQHLRPKITGVLQTWQPLQEFSSQKDLIGAVEMCNGAAVCRKEEGVMCPSFQATREEMHSTRGRANLLRALITSPQPTPEADLPLNNAIFQALDLCLACKGCKAECPSAVDMAKLKSEFLQAYYRRRQRPLRDVLFSRIDDWTRWASSLAGVVNPLLNSPIARRLGERWLGITARRRLPMIQWRRRLRPKPVAASPERVIFLPDSFTRYFHPEIEQAGLEVLAAAGCQVIHLPIVGAGRPLISKGFLGRAKIHATRVVEAISRLDPKGELPVIGLEPSEVYALGDEYPNLIPGDEWVSQLAERAWMMDEFLLRPDPKGIPRLQRLNLHPLTGAQGTKPVFLHGHCHQKAKPPAADGFPVGVEATREVLAGLGYSVEVIPAGCCGMAGSFGFEVEHYALSIQIGELSLFPQVREVARRGKVVTAGVSCRMQIEDGTGVKPLHPLQLVAERLS